MKHRPDDSSDRVTQLEQALAISRDLYRDAQLKLEAIERSWSAKEAALLQRIAWLQSRLTSEVVRESRTKH